MAGMMGGANHLGVGERPSESHHWVPGMGWVFMPTYAEGESLNEQSAAAGGKSFDIAVDRQSLADAEATGVRSHSSLNEGGLTHEQRAAIKERQQSHLWYQGGMDHYDGSIGQDGWETAASEYFNSIGRPQAVSPWQHTSDWAKADTFKAIQEANYNPFIGNEGAWVTPGGENGQDLRGSNNGTAEGYRDDSIAGWFKNAFAGDDMVKHRREALNTLSSWNGQERHMGGWRDGLGKGINKATERMTEEYFNQMDLANKFGLQWQGGSSNQSASQQANAEALAENALKMGLKAQGSSSGMLSRARDVSDPEWSALSDSNSGSQMGPFMLGQLAKRG